MIIKLSCHHPDYINAPPVMMIMCKCGELAFRFEDKFSEVEYKTFNWIMHSDYEIPDKQFDGTKIYFADIMQLLLDNDGKFIRNEDNGLASKL